mmetsp:Transcript_35116/g.89136  ORF Transcript_35116/g.89136 Transcript_35116/m.89136 type:complete len:201 (+) Transcript_35116:282-884(+)
MKWSMATRTPHAMPISRSKALISRKVHQMIAYSAGWTRARLCHSQSRIRSAAMKVSTAPKKSLGTHETIEMGSTKRPSSTTMTTRPHTRELVPERKVKMVCEKMYEPVKPPESPESALEMPTLMSSRLKSSALPMSIWIAATSREEEKATTTYMPIHVGSSEGSSSQRTSEGRKKRNASSGGAAGCGGAIHPASRSCSRS